MAFKFCPECGFKLDKEHKFCPECGFKLGESGAVQQVKSEGIKNVAPVKDLINTNDLDSSFERQLESQESVSESYDKELDKAFVYCKREMFDKAATIYETLINKNFNDVNAYIGLIRISSKNFTNLSGGQIDGDINALFNVANVNSNYKEYDEFNEFLKKKGLLTKWQTLTGEEERKKKREEEKYREEVYQKLFGKNSSSTLFGGDSLERFAREKKVDEYIKKEREEKARLEEERKKKLLEEQKKRELEEKKRLAEEERLKKKELEKQEAERRAIEREIEKERKRKEKEEKEILAAERRVKRDLNKLFVTKKSSTLFDNTKYELRGDILTDIGDTSLEVYDVPEGVMRVTSNAFINCKNARIIILPSTVKEIESYAFKGLTNLKSLDLGKTNIGISSLRGYALSDAQIEELILPPLSKDFSSIYISRLPNLKYLQAESSEFCSVECGALIYKTGKKIVEYIPPKSDITSYDFNKCVTPVTEIGKDLFLNNKNVESVILKPTIQSILWNAFSGCEKLKSINLEKVYFVTSNAFYNCRSLKKVDLSTVQEVQKEAFYGCEELDVVGLSNVRRIGVNAFSGCGGIKTLQLGMVKTIEDAAFKSCKNLESVVINLNGYINSQAFMDCAKLKTVTLKDGGFISENAFSNCKNLSQINLEKVTYITEEAFKNCTSLLSANLDSIKSVGENAFDGCSSLSSLTLSKGAEIESYAFSDCVNLRKIEFKENTVIKSMAFKDCTNLTEITVSTGTTIEYGAFSGTNIKFVQIPKKCKVAKGAFPDGCKVKKPLFG